MLSEFIERLAPNLRETFLELQSPADIQAYLDSIPYVGEDLNRSPLRLMQDRQGHCLDGGLFAATALRKIGYPPVIVDLTVDPGTDDDHVLAIYRINGLYGAVAKSNYVGLRYREPIHRTLRELVITYFEQYYSLHGVKTLRGYTRPVNLARFDANGWMWSEEGVEEVVKKLYSMKPVPLLSKESAAMLSAVDRRSYEAGMVGTNIDGVYVPKVNG